MVNIPGVGKLIRRGIVAAPTEKGNLIHELRGRFAQSEQDPEQLEGDQFARLIDAVPFKPEDEEAKGDGKQRRK